MTTLSPLPNSLSQSATDRVFDALAQAIISFELPPGSKVSEAEVATQLGVSRQPVRDAFFRLSQQGFLAIQPQRATLITKISEQAVMEAAFIRTALEVACVKVAAAQISEIELDELRTLLLAQQSAVDRKNSAEFHELDEQFHKRICKIAGHGHAWNLIQEKKAHMDRVRFLSLPYDSQLAHDEHVHIMKALSNHSAEDAEKTMCQHIQRISVLVIRMREAHGEHFAPENSQTAQAN